MAWRDIDAGCSVDGLARTDTGFCGDDAAIGSWRSFRRSRRRLYGRRAHDLWRHSDHYLDSKRDPDLPLRFHGANPCRGRWRWWIGRRRRRWWLLHDRGHPDLRLRRERFGAIWSDNWYSWRWRRGANEV